jgi:hypothetical protein
MAVKKKAPAKKKEERGKSEAITKVELKPIARKSAKISKAQKFQLDLIARTNFNLFNGKKIVELLKENRKIWRSVLLPLDSISLRDLEDNWWHADTLFIYAEEGWQFSLEELVTEQFQADEIHWIGGSSAMDMLGTTEVNGKSQLILSVWWD